MVGHVAPEAHLLAEQVKEMTESVLAAGEHRGLEGCRRPVHADPAVVVTSAVNGDANISLA
jgi:hypothetical protein